MPMPSIRSIQGALLQFADNRGCWHRYASIPFLVDRFNMSDGDLQATLANGKSVLKVRIGTALVYLKKAHQLENPDRGYYQITGHGGDPLPHVPDNNDGEFEEAPEERLDAAYRELQDDLATNLLEQIQNCTPEFFERLVVDLMVGMGYGGSREQAGHAIGHPGDEGIDGIINEDPLGLDIIYLQAKRWQASASIGRPVVQAFAGALQGQRARKGVFITTSSFTNEARAFVDNIDSRIVLIDGRKLAALMIEHGIGVTTQHTYELKGINLNYFNEE